MRILYFAKDAPYINSGYGKCCREICKRLGRFGHEVAIFATVGNRASSLFEWEGLKIYPGANNIFGDDIILDHYNDWKADILITQIDLWPLKTIPELAMAGKINWVPYPPIDSYPIFHDSITKLRAAIHVVAMCDWAKHELKQYGIDSTSVHHGVDVTKFRYLDLPKESLKEELGIPPGTWLIGMVQANQFLRKAIEEQLLGVKLFRQSHPDIDFKVYFHTTQIRGEESFDIESLAEFIGVSDLILMPDLYKYHKGISEDQMARIYNAMDVLLSATNGEGFGLPVIEAQACGVPVIATDCMSFPELVKYGSLVRVKTWMTLPTMLRKAIPDEYDIAEKLFDAYNKKYDHKEISNMAHYFWNWDSKIIQEWLWSLQIVQDKIDAACFKPPKPSKKSEKLGESIICE